MSTVNAATKKHYSSANNHYRCHWKTKTTLMIVYRLRFKSGQLFFENSIRLIFDKCQ